MAEAEPIFKLNLDIFRSGEKIASLQADEPLNIIKIARFSLTQSECNQYNFVYTDKEGQTFEGDIREMVSLFKRKYFIIFSYYFQVT